MVVKHLEDSWKEERNRFFCGFAMDVADKHERSMLIIGEKLSNSKDHETGVLSQCGLSIAGNFNCNANLSITLLQGQISCA